MESHCGGGGSACWVPPSKSASTYKFLWKSFRETHYQKKYEILPQKYEFCFKMSGLNGFWMVYLKKNAQKPRKIWTVFERFF